MRVRLRISCSSCPGNFVLLRGAYIYFYGFFFSVVVGCSKVVIYVIVVGNAICYPRVHTPVLTQEIEGEAET